MGDGAFAVFKSDVRLQRRTLRLRIVLQRVPAIVKRVALVPRKPVCNLRCHATALDGVDGDGCGGFTHQKGLKSPSILNSLLSNVEFFRFAAFMPGWVWQLPSGRKCAKCIQRAGRATRRHLKHMGVNHGGGHIAVAQQLLHGADVGARLQQVGGEAVAQGVDRGMFGNARFRQCSLQPGCGAA